MILHEKPDFAAVIRQDDDEWIRWHNLDTESLYVPEVDVITADIPHVSPTQARVAHSLVEYDVMIERLTRSC